MFEHWIKKVYRKEVPVVNIDDNEMQRFLRLATFLAMVLEDDGFPFILITIVL